MKQQFCSKLVFVLVTFLMCALSANASTSIPGDIDNDGEVSITDVIALIEEILGDCNNLDADVNHDGEIDIADVNVLIDIILNGSTPTTSSILSFTVNGETFKMIKVEGGTFTIGTVPEQATIGSEHQVTLSSYYIGETEVTQALWMAVMGINPSYMTSSTDLYLPVEGISWDDCQEFVAALKDLTGRDFRLPTEAEWEFAARGGNKSQGYLYSGSNTVNDVAWYFGNSGLVHHTVASKMPNELGIYDMSGNIEEWIYDWYADYSSEPQTNPTGPASGTERVVRGGEMWGGSIYCRVIDRYSHYETTRKNVFLGMRLAL